MSDSKVTKVTRQSYGSRIMQSIRGVLFGVVLVVIAFPLLFWNEGRAVQTAKSLAEGSAAVRSVPAESIDAANEDALVHLTGMATTEDVLNDSTFGITEPNAIRLQRSVEMYQWRETSKTETKREVGGSEERITTYDYSKTWSESLIDSTRFQSPEQHANPSSMPFSGHEEQASRVTVGAFVLSDGLIGRIRQAENRPFTDEDIEALPESVQERVGTRELSIRDGALYATQEPATDTIGDVRVRFEVVRPQTVSVISAQIGGNLVPYQTSAGDTLVFLQSGMHSAEAMFAAAVSANVRMTWILRFVGFFLMFVGFGMVFKPLAVLADVLPFLGDIMRMGTGLVAGVLAFSLSLTTIAIGWIFYRPVLGVLLLAVAIGALIAVKRLATNSRSATPDAPAMPETEAVAPEATEPPAGMMPPSA